MPEAAPVTITFLPANPRMGPPRCLSPVDGLSAGGLDDRTLHRAVRLVLRDPRPRTVGARQRAHGLQERPRPGRGGRAVRVGRLLDGRAPLPLGVLALLEPRGPLRGRRRADRADPHRLRGAAHAPALQPPGAHGGIGGRARPALRRPGRPRDRPVLDPGRARGVRCRPGRDPRHVAGGHRPRGGVLDQRRVRVGRQVLADAQATGPAQAPPEPAPAHLGCDQQRGRAPPGGLSGPGSVLVRRGGLARGGEGQGRHLPRGRRQLHRAHRRLREQPGPPPSPWRCAAPTGPPRRTWPGSPSSGTRRPVPGTSRR